MCVHTVIDTDMHTHTHYRKHTCMHGNTQIVTVTNMHMPVWLCMHTHMCLHCDMNTHSHPHLHAHAHTHTHTHTHTRAHCHTQACMHTQSQTCMCDCACIHTHMHTHTHTTVIPGHVRRVRDKVPTDLAVFCKVFRHFLHQISVCWLSFLTFTECTLFQCCYDYACCVTMPVSGCCTDQWTWCPSRRTLKTGRFAQQPSSSVTWCSCSPMPSCTTAPTTMSTAWPRRCMMMSWCT